MAEHDNLQYQKQALDLPSIVEAAGVELKRLGPRHVGLCCFHADTNPSFYVFPNGRFKCFGCGERGDAIDFIQKIHGCNFKEALRILGIDQGHLTPTKRKEIEHLNRQRGLLRAFRQWEVEASDYAATLCRCAGKLLANIKTEADLGKFGHLYHWLESWQYHLNILNGDDDGAKWELFNAGIYY